MSHFSNPFILHVDNLAVGYDRTIEAANYTKSTQLNPPITELITITIAKTTLKKTKKQKNNNKKNWRISKMEELLNQHIIDPRHSTGDICSRCICFFGN